MSRRFVAGRMIVRVVVLSIVSVLSTHPSVMATAQSPDQEYISIATAFNEAREACYATPECPNVDAFMALFLPDARRTEIQRNNNVVQLESAEALRNDHLRVAQTFTGRQVETTGMMVQGRNVIMLQLNRDPGATVPNPFTSVLRIEDGRIAHWILIAP
jgi:hypothetical protein